MTEVPEDQIRGLERQAGRMEEGLEKLGDHIETAQEKADEQRERANPEAVAGDWQDESAGAQQGDDAKDAEGAEGPGHTDEQGGRGGASAVADAPVHDAEQVDPG